MNNIRIEKDLYFQTALHFDNSFWINSYDVTLSMIIETDSEHEQNVAMDRIVYYIKNVLQNSILISVNDEYSMEKYRDAGMRVCLLPAEPYDQIFASILILKLNAIMENKLHITDMVLGSSMSDGVRYTMVAEVAESTYSGNQWWNKPCISLCNEDNLEFLNDNVVKLFEDNQWLELGLSWKETVTN